MQAASLSFEICIIVDSRITKHLRLKFLGKPTMCNGRKVAILIALLASNQDTTGVLEWGMHS